MLKKIASNIFFRTREQRENLIFLLISVPQLRQKKRYPRNSLSLVMQKNRSNYRKLLCTSEASEKFFFLIRKCRYKYKSSDECTCNESSKSISLGPATQTLYLYLRYLYLSDLCDTETQQWTRQGPWCATVIRTVFWSVGTRPCRDDCRCRRELSRSCLKKNKVSGREIG